MRADLSTYHAVEYDLATGERTRGFTFQGAFDESCWPRGQAWAIYGFAATARATGKPEYLELAERLADYYLGRLDDGLVPYWDFDDPAIPDAPRDSSASAITAAALLDIAAQHPDAADGRAPGGAGLPPARYALPELPRARARPPRAAERGLLLQAARRGHGQRRAVRQG